MDKKFQDEWMEIKAQNKLRLAEVIKKECGIIVSPNALFDIQV